MQTTETVNPGEVLAARCTYNTTGHHTPTKIGATGGDEMCNLYLMFYTLSAKDDFIVCADEQNPALTSQLPYGSDVPLPPNPALEHKAEGHEAGLVNYNNGLPDQDTVPSPVKKGESSVRKRPGVDTGSVKKKPGVEPNYGAPQSAAASPPFLPPTSLPSHGRPAHKVGIEQLVPENMNSSVILAAAISVPLTVLVALCLACRRCKKRGKGTMVGSTNKSKFKDWNVGDILGRNKDGFQPVNTDERDGMLDDESDSERHCVSINQRIQSNFDLKNHIPFIHPFHSLHNLQPDNKLSECLNECVFVISFVLTFL